MMPHTRRTAIVTGAGRGIGAGIAQRLYRDGHDVALLDVDEEAACATAGRMSDAGGRAFGIRADVSDAESVDAAIERVVAELGAPTVLVNNAGITRDNLLFKMSTTDWDDVMGVHLRGAFLMARAVQSHMVAAGWGRIVSLSSIGALGNRGQANYSAAKAGLQGFTKTLAIELGPFGITVNAIAPGFVETDMTRATAHRLGISFEEFAAHSAEQIAVRRVGVPADVAAAAAFFVSDEASFVSGQVLSVAGGPAG